MARQPFDPGKMKAPPAPPPDGALSVTQLARRIESALAAEFPDAVRVVGEVSTFSERTHWYFSLKDVSSVVSCVMFASAAKRAGYRPRPGEQVVCRGRVEFYAPSGRVTLVVDRLEPVGVGAREAALRQLVEEARAMGWLDAARKRALPAFPRRVAVLTSAGGAALQDVLVTMRRRCPAVEVLVLDVRVQGDHAAREVARGLAYLSAHAGRLGVDAVLVTRGGGSAEDLWSFNDRAVAEAIVKCSVPVVAAIGHEVDTTLAELVADERCATPTQAAVRLTPDAGALQREVASRLARARVLAARALWSARKDQASAARLLRQAARARAAAAHRALARLGTRLAHASPARVQARTRAALESRLAALHASARRRLREADPRPLVARLSRAAGDIVRARRDRLDATRRELDSVSPLRVLERGYSVTRRAGGGLVRRPSDVRPGERLETRLAEGTIESVVGGTTHAPLRPRRRAPGGEPGQGSLFNPPGAN